MMELYSGQEYMTDLMIRIKQKNVSIKYICKEARISERSFRRWLNAERSPKVSDLFKLYKVVNHK